MVDMDWKQQRRSPSAGITKSMHRNDPPAGRSSRSPDGIFQVTRRMVDDGEIPEPSPSDAAAYDHYLRLPDLMRFWDSREWPEWKNESLIKPSLHALEITFRLISIAFSDFRTYTNNAEWRRRLESVADHEIELIGSFCEEERGERNDSIPAPTFDLGNWEGVLQRDGSSPEVWKVNRASSDVVLVSRTSEQSLLPRLRTWKKAEETASKIGLSIECHMKGSPFTLGIGEPNLSCKRTLRYDLVCRPSDLYALKMNPLDRRIGNAENQMLYTVHQILEAWIFIGRELIHRIGESVDLDEWAAASRDCWLLERVWKIREEIQELHMLMDPSDFLRLKNELSIGRSSGFCLRSRSLYALTMACKELKHRVPAILGVEVDPHGAPKIQEAAMKLFRGHDSADRIHLLQALQAVEAAVKRFYFGYYQVVAVVMGCLEIAGNRSHSEIAGGLFPAFLVPTSPASMPPKLFSAISGNTNVARARVDQCSCR